jgi:hypothetical protein
LKQQSEFPSDNGRARLRDFIARRKLVANIAFALAAGGATFLPALALPATTAAMGGNAGVAMMSLYGAAVSANVVLDYASGRLGTSAGMDLVQRSLSGLMRRILRFRREGKSPEGIAREGEQLKTGRSHHIPIVQNYPANASRAVLMDAVRIIGVIPAALALAVGFSGLTFVASGLIAVGITLPIAAAASVVALRNRNEHVLFEEEEQAQNELTRNIESAADTRSRAPLDHEAVEAIAQSRVRTERKLMHRLNNVLVLNVGSLGMILVPGFLLASGVVGAGNAGGLFAAISVMTANVTGAVVRFPVAFSQWQESRRHLRKSDPLRHSAAELRRLPEPEKAGPDMPEIAGATLRLRGDYPIHDPYGDLEPSVLRLDARIGLAKTGVVAVTRTRSPHAGEYWAASTFVGSIGNALSRSTDHDRCRLEFGGTQTFDGEVFGSLIGWLDDRSPLEFTLLGGEFVPRSPHVLPLPGKLNKADAYTAVSRGHLAMLVVQSTDPASIEVVSLASSHVPVVTAALSSQQAWDANAHVVTLGEVSPSLYGIVEQHACARSAGPDSLLIRSVLEDSQGHCSRPEQVIVPLAIAVTSVIQDGRKVDPATIRRIRDDCVATMTPTVLPGVGLCSTAKDRLANDLLEAATAGVPNLGQRGARQAVLEGVRAMLDVLPEADPRASRTWQRWNIDALDAFGRERVASESTSAVRAPAFGG